MVPEVVGGRYFATNFSRLGLVPVASFCERSNIKRWQLWRFRLMGYDGSTVINMTRGPGSDVVGLTNGSIFLCSPQSFSNESSRIDKSRDFPVQATPR